MNFVRIAAGEGPVTHRWLHRAHFLAGQHARAEYLGHVFRVRLRPLERRSRALRREAELEAVAQMDGGALEREVDATLESLK